MHLAVSSAHTICRIQTDKLTFLGYYVTFVLECVISLHVNWDNVRGSDQSHLRVRVHMYL